MNYHKRYIRRRGKKMNLLNSKSIGRTLKERRLQLGYTQELAAEKSGISYSYYTKIERGEQLPSIEICVQLAQTFHLSLDYWLLGTSSDAEVSSELIDFAYSLREIDLDSLRKVEKILQKAELLTK
jgi:transcriptional regulator with XRE-family HTH domain